MEKQALGDSHIDWIERDRKVIDGLDQLGIELVSVNLYQALLPGLTNVTERARYYAFYPWIVHRFAQDGPKARTKAAWRNWFRALDFGYAVACIAHEQAIDKDLSSSVVGEDAARRLLKGKAPSARIDFRPAARVDDAGNIPRSGAYFKNPEGGFGQYYRGPLRDLGVIIEDDGRAWPNVLLSNYAGTRIARTLDERRVFSELQAIAQEGDARLEELSRIGAAVHPSAIEADSPEEKVLRALFFGTDEELCQGQQQEETGWRRASLLAMLHYVRAAESVEGDVAWEFRWACACPALPDGSRWKIPARLKPVVELWGSYQRNDLLNYCLECLFHTSLRLLDEEPYRPADLARKLAQLAMASVSAVGEDPRLPALPSRVSEWVKVCARPEHETASDPWGVSSTWAWAERLRDAVAEAETEVIAALAARVLGRLVTDRGTSRAHPFLHHAGAVEMAQAHEVHLKRWWDRVNGHADERTVAFLEEAILEWVLFRHLRVATRKLANQGVSTFKFRPEQGRLVLTAQKLTAPTFTAPRLHEAYRILEDLHYIRRANGAAEIGAAGKGVLEASLA
jgi:hypothetical protein